MLPTKHFEVLGEVPLIERTWIPGYTGPVDKMLNGPMPVRIRQYGICAVNQVADIKADEGNRAVTTSVVTLLQGTYAGCYKELVNLRPIMTAAGGRVRYEIFWQQTAYTS